MFLSDGHSTPIFFCTYDKTVSTLKSCRQLLKRTFCNEPLLQHHSTDLIRTKSGLKQFSQQLHCYLPLKEKLKKITLPQDEGDYNYVCNPLSVC